MGEVVCCLPDKKNNNSARSPALASARIAPKISQGQLQAIYTEFPKFHPNPFTAGGVIDERVNIAETRHKVFPILGEASSSSNKRRISKTRVYTMQPVIKLVEQPVVSCKRSLINVGVAYWEFWVC